MRARLAAAVLSCLGHLAAQAPPGSSVPADLTGIDANPTQGPAATRWTFGKDALAAGKPDDAIPHLLAALEFQPSSPGILQDLLAATAANPDAASIWRERLLRALADAQGKVKLDANQRKALGDGKAGQRLTELRAQALGELAKAADKHKHDPKAVPGHALVARQLVEAALTVGEHAPGLLRANAPVLQRALDQHPVDFDRVFAALGRILKAGSGVAANTPTTGAKTDPATVRAHALAAARIVRGLARQAAFQDLKGPRPPALGTLPDEAAAVIAAQQERVRAEVKVWTIAELEALDAKARAEFTLAHRGEDQPGVALSPKARYRIETVCGYETLIGAARTIELHHARLCDHFGSDPFLQQQGLVRIVPGHDDLESEGAPYWWAGGFQAGERTTIRFAWSSVPAMGKILTHELTHRFDGVLRAFAPSWYGEGHASWTAAHYGRMAETTCTEDCLDRGAVLTTRNKGYGQRDNFERLLRGQIADYRDNYPAGYAIYAFLRSFPPDAPRYHGALARYEANLRAGTKDPVQYVALTFADGKDGRPRTFDDLFGDWQAFLQGIADSFDDKKTPPPWVARYAGLPAGDSEPLVLDEPTWSWERSHHEPFFGQEHAVAAAILCQQAGEPAAAVAAWLWAFAVDGWSRRGADALPVLAQGLGRADAAVAAAALARQRWTDAPAVAAALAPTTLPKTRAFLAALRADVAERTTAGHPIAAAAMRVHHDRIAALLGLPALPAAADTLAVTPPSIPRLLRTFTESSLVDYDERRVAGLWFPTADGDLHVGRKEPPQTTGTVERASPQRHAFAHTTEWIAPGHYVVRGRVHFTTAYVSGAIVLGLQRRDRTLRLNFHAGDWNHAFGARPTSEGFQHLHLDLAGMWQRDGQLPGSAAAWTFQLPKDATWFDFAMHVHGARVVVTVFGEAVLGYTVPDGAPIEGRLGFAMNTGAIRVQQPTLQRLDATDDRDAGLDLARQPRVPLDDLLLLPVTGVPRSDCGTMVLWLPPATADDAPLDALPRALLVIGKTLQEPWDHPQAWVLAVPAGTAATAIEQAQAQLREYRAEPMPVVEHRVGAPFLGSAPWLLFVDSSGVLRAAAEFGEVGILTRVQRWARMFRTPDRTAK